MRQRLILSVVATCLMCVGANADVIIYATSNPPAPPSNLDAVHSAADIGSGSFFDVFIRTDVALNGVAIDVAATGPAIKLTGATVFNPLNGANARWNGGQLPVVAGSGLSISPVEGYALAPNPGLNPANANTDPHYIAGVNAYRFARINYDIVGLGESFIKFSIGGNEIGTVLDTNIRRGVGDPPCDFFSIDGSCIYGYTNEIPEGRIAVIPEPTTVGFTAVFVLVMGTFGWRRHD